MNVIFDIGMVLADFRWRAYCNELGIPEEVTDIFADKMICDPVWDEFDMGIRPYREVIAEIGERFPGYEKEYASFEKFSDAVREYIYYYNNERIQAKTKWMPPVKYREASMCST